MKLFLDMDGVLADFVAGACFVHGKDPDEVNSWDFFKEWGLTTQQFWDSLHGRAFWRNLKDTAELQPLLWLADEYETRILTSPCWDRECIPGKQDWLEDRDITIPMIPIKEKWLVAGRERILIDDSDPNIYSWRQAGGIGVLFPRPWNTNAGKDWKSVLSEEGGIYV